METAEDTLVSSLITTARKWAEEWLNRSLITQTWALTLSRWGCGGIRLPRPVVQSVTSIYYTDTDGNSTELAADQYTLLANRLPAEIVPAYGVTWPSLYDVEDGITVTYVSGFGDDGADVPEPIRLALLMLVAHWYENREPGAVGTTYGEIPFTVKALLGPYQVWT